MFAFIRIKAVIAEINEIEEAYADLVEEREQILRSISANEKTVRLMISAALVAELEAGTEI